MIYYPSVILWRSPIQFCILNEYNILGWHAEHINMVIVYLRNTSLSRKKDTTTRFTEIAGGSCTQHKVA